MKELPFDLQNNKLNFICTIFNIPSINVAYNNSL